MEWWRHALFIGIIFLFSGLARAMCEPDPENPVSLRGSVDDAQRWQNIYADRDEFERIQDDEERERLIGQGVLVPIHDASLGETEATTHIRIDPRLEPRKRYVRWCTKQFLLLWAEEFYQQFKKPIQINSAVRTVKEQKALPRVNGNAAPFDGPEASTHLTGATIDIAKKPGGRWMRSVELQEMRRRLLEGERLGIIEATEEQYQAVFHIFVRKCYVE